MFKTRIRQHERGLRFRYGDFVRLLPPGAYRLWSRLFSRTRASIEVVDTLAFRFEHRLLDVLLARDDVRESLVIVDLADHERALIWKDGRLAHIVGPGRHAFWKTPYDVRVEMFDTEQYRFAHARLETVLLHADAQRWLTGVEVDAHEDVLLFHNGQLVEQLREGKHIFWKGTGRLTWKSIDRREQSLDVSGQEIMTRDKVTLRVNLLVTYVVADAEKAVTAVSDHAQALYRAAQLALRAAIGTRNLDALLTDKASVGDELRQELAERADAFGVTVSGVGLRDIILPGEMKTIMNQVIEAEKQAQANLIRRREETAAARSQANTAKLLADNPQLARLKELEMLQEILAGTKTTFVFGNSDLRAQVTNILREQASHDTS